MSEPYPGTSRQASIRETIRQIRCGPSSRPPTARSAHHPQASEPNLLPAAVAGKSSVQAFESSLAELVGDRIAAADARWRVLLSSRHAFFQSHPLVSCSLVVACWCVGGCVSPCPVKQNPTRATTTPTRATIRYTHSHTRTHTRAHILTQIRAHAQIPARGRIRSYKVV